MRPRAGAHGLPLLLCGFPPSLKRLRTIRCGGSLEGQYPPRRCGWGGAAALTRTPPQWHTPLSCCAAIAPQGLAHQLGAARSRAEGWGDSTLTTTKVRQAAQPSPDLSTRPLGRTKAAGRVATGSGWAAWHRLDMGRAAPYPAQGRCAPLEVVGLLLRAVCCAPAGLVLPRNPRVPAYAWRDVVLSPTPPGSQRRLPVAATFFSSFTGRAM